MDGINFRRSEWVEGELGKICELGLGFRRFFKQSIEARRVALHLNWSRGLDEIQWVIKGKFSTSVNCNRGSVDLRS